MTTAELHAMLELMKRHGAESRLDAIGEVDLDDVVLVLHGESGSIVMQPLAGIDIANVVANLMESLWQLLGHAGAINPKTLQLYELLTEIRNGAPQQG